jgi:choline-sulfatase
MTVKNIVILKSDEHNPFYSSVYDHPFIETPNMERLARMGTVFENAYCTSPLCMPSRSSFISGRRVHEIQTYSNCNAFPFDYSSYGGVLNQQGIHTVLLGKTDVYNQSAALGFSEVILPGDRKPPGDTNISRNPLTIRQGAEGRANGFGVKENPFGGDQRRIEAALEWITDKAPSMNRPWVMDVNLDNPHFPHYVTQELWDKYPQGEDLPAYGADSDSANHPYALDLRAHFQTGEFTESQIRGLRRGYLGCVTYVDQELGRLLDVLEETRLMENTIVVYTSDHGEMLGKFGMWWKCSLYEDSARVPLLTAGYGFQPGTRVKTPVDLLDLQAAIFKAVDAERPMDWAGTPLQDIPMDDPERAVFSEYHGHGTRASAYMIRKGRWKLIYYCAAPNQLFDLEADPDELNNLSDKYPDIVRELEGELENICSPDEENIRAEQFIRRQLQAICNDSQ